MRHHNTKRKFGRERKVRNALMKSLAFSLIKHGKIKTTDAKARELRPFMEKLVTKAKENTLSARKIVLSRLMNRTPEVKKLFSEIGPKYIDRKGGYVRIVKLPQR